MEITAHACALINTFNYEFAVLEASLPATAGSGTEELTEAIPDSLPNNDYPHLREFTAKNVLRPGYDFCTEFSLDETPVQAGRAHRQCSLFSTEAHTLLRRICY